MASPKRQGRGDRERIGGPSVVCRDISHGGQAGCRATAAGLPRRCAGRGRRPTGSASTRTCAIGCSTDPGWLRYKHGGGTLNRRQAVCSNPRLT